MPSVILLRTPTDLQVNVSDEVPCEIARQVAAVVRREMHHIVGVWLVTVERSPDRGHWRVELRGPTGRHSWSFFGPLEKLPEVIGEKLGTFIRVATLQYQYSARVTPSRPVAPDALTSSWHAAGTVSASSPSIHCGATTVDDRGRHRRGA